MPFLRKLGWLARRRRKDDELAAELQFHLEEEMEDRTQAGLPKEEARWAARRELGNLGRVQEQTREAWSWVLFEQLLQDVRYAWRTMRHNPGFTLLAALSLALGIGANTAIYSVMHALLMRSLPVADPGSLVVLNWHVSGKKSLRVSVVQDVSGYFYRDPQTGLTTGIFPYPAFELLRRTNEVLSVLFAYHPAEKLNVLIRGQAEVTNAEYVSGDFFRGLALVPAAGRLITADDDRAGAAPVAVLSYAFAQARFGDAASAAGQPLVINGVPFTAIGVAPPAFSGIDPASAPAFYLPMHAEPLLNSDQDPKADPGKRYIDDHYYWVEMMGRLRPGVPMAQARAALAPVFEQWVATTARNDEERRNLPEFLISEGSRGLDNLRRAYSRPVYVLLGLVGLILAIACANIANLLLARATARRREMAVRLSMGAGRGRVIRQLLTESILLAFIGGTAGVLIAVWGIRFLTVLLASGGKTFAIGADLNWQVLTAAVALTLLTGVLFGLAPALQATRVDATPVLKEARTAGPQRRTRLGLSLSHLLLVSQIAISLLLLVGAGLFVRTLSNLRGLELGFGRENLLVFTLDAWQAGHRKPEIISFYSEMLKRFEAIPGIQSASAANAPLFDDAWAWPVVPLGRQKPEDASTGRGSGMSATTTRVLATGPGFFRTMHIPVLAGREFDERDRAGSAPVVIVNEAWTKANLGGGNPVGQTVVSFGMRKKPEQMQIVGLVKNARYEKLTGDFPAIVYLPYQQSSDIPVEDMAFFLRAPGDPLAYAGAVRQIVRQADGRIPVTKLETQTAVVDEQMAQQILFARLCTAFALLALAIACVGLYGTMSYSVARRTSEIGIRMALGAQRRNVVWMVVRQVVLLAAVSVAISVPMALAVARLVESLLFGVKPNDPEALAAAVAILLVAALLAAYLPARRASRIDPMVAVRHE